jgi:leucyl-tRNA---protein transferase
LRRHFSEQYFTSSQTFSQRLRHCIGLPQAWQSFSGKVDFVYFFCSVLFFGIFRMIDENFIYVNERFYFPQAKPQEMDFLWRNGWRHFGTYFFRYSLIIYENDTRHVLPLRINLSKFSFSKSQRRILNKNKDLTVKIRPIKIDDGKISLFEIHKQRFKENTPESIYNFLSKNPARVPCKALELCLFKEKRLIAVSFFDVGVEAVSSIYGMFAPEESARSLGVLTMLLEIDFALQNGKQFYYHGYAYEGKSFYDYKKRFSALETFDWQGNWIKFEEKSSPTI